MGSVPVAFELAGDILFSETCGIKRRRKNKYLPLSRSTYDYYFLFNF